MKKWVTAVLVIAALAAISPWAALTLAVTGLAEEELPPAVREAYLSRQGGLEDIADIINIQDAEGSDWCLIAQSFGWMQGYRKMPSGEWASYWSGTNWPCAADTYLEREGDTAFRVASPSLDAWMRYESRGEGFLLTGWRDGSAWKGTVEVRDHAAVFTPDGGGAPVEVAFGDEMEVCLSDFDSLPKTPEEMRVRAGIGKAQAQAAMPGWTLGYYEMFNSGTEAWAAFYRIEDGRLTLCRLTLASGKDVTGKTESLSVPLSEGFLRRMETEDMKTLLDASGYGSTFLTQDAWDREAIPIQGRIIENDLQRNGLLVLTERDGRRYIALAEPDANGGWQVKESKPLPEKCRLDLFHSGDDELGMEWMAGERNCQCGFQRQADGAWRMTWAWSEEGDYSILWYGVMTEWQGLYSNVYAYGTPAFADLFESDLNALPASGEQAAAQMDTVGWAAVKNPTPQDRLHLRSEPSKNGDSLGKFYNGTPLQVLEERGDWARVRIGLGKNSLEGWMMKEYLAFGDQLRRVTQAFPELMTREEAQNRHPQRIDGKGEADFEIDGWAQIIGIRQDTRQWIVMMRDGSLCLTPLDWFWEGNG